MLEFGKDGKVFVEGEDEGNVLDLLSVAGFSPIATKGSVERFSRFGRTFERRSAFLSGGMLCMTLEEV